LGGTPQARTALPFLFLFNNPHAPLPPPPPLLQLNGDKLTDPAAIAALTASLEILLAASDTARTAGRALSRAASKRPALKGEAGNSLLANLMGE
jgi:hypothetical protein